MASSEFFRRQVVISVVATSGFIEHLDVVEGFGHQCIANFSDATVQAVVTITLADWDIALLEVLTKHRGLWHANHSPPRESLRLRLRSHCQIKALRRGLAPRRIQPLAKKPAATALAAKLPC